MREGVGMVSTLMLKDTSDRTAFKVFEPGGTADLPGFGFASNLMLLADPASFRQLPWAPGTGWVRASPGSRTATPVELDTRRVLQRALERLAEAGFGHEVRPGNRVPHLPHRRTAQRSSIPSRRPGRARRPR